MRGLLVGRFQPFHRGHLACVTSVRSSRRSDSLVVVIGSAQESHTAANPFTAGERVEMIERALSEARVDGCWVVPVNDIGRHALWVAHLESLLPKFERIYANNPLTELLFRASGYEVERPSLVNRQWWQGAEIRRRIAVREPWTDLVPPSVAEYLGTIDAEARIRTLQGDAAVPEVHSGDEAGG